MIGVEGERIVGVGVGPCTGLGVIVARGRVVVLLSLSLSLSLSLLLSLLLTLFSFVEGCIGSGVVGSLGVIHAIRGWTCVIVMGLVVAGVLWLCRGCNVQVLQ